MASFLLFLVFLFLTLSCHGSEGANKLHRQQIFQQENDEEYDCVDIYKQPAFDNVMLKNHKIQMSPSFLPKIEGADKSSSFRVPGKGCPEGMVPIQRTKVDRDYDNIHPLSNTEPGKHFAVFNMKGTIYGATANVTVNHPVNVKMHQISMSQIRIESGPPGELNFIQVGWAVHPRLYGDTRTRVTAYWTADNSKKTGCYNLICQGFVQVDREITLGASYIDIAKARGPMYSTQPFLFMDNASGNWWFLLDNKKLGYFPKELFTHLEEGGSLVQFGGWTYNSPDGLSPPMGCGYFPREQNAEFSYFSQVQVLDRFNKSVAITEDTLQKFTDNTNCYDAEYLGVHDPKMGIVFSYGGPGGNCGI